MAPKRGTAKHLARQRVLATSNTRSLHRRAALRELNALVDVLELTINRLDIRAPDTKLLEKFLRLLNRRCTDEPLHSRFADAVSKWVDNGGVLPESMSLVRAGGTTLADEDGQPAHANGEEVPVVARHKVLKSGFRLKSKAFMMTHNSREFTRSMWPRYRSWVVALFRRYGAKAWAACLELSENAAGSGAVSATVYHFHAYLFWEDGVGIQLLDLAPLAFVGVRPRVDACVQVANGRSLRTAALHGLWYVTIMKSGTVEADTNHQMWKDYQPCVRWLIGLWEAGKLSNDEYMKLSQRFRSGHAKRKLDVAEVARDELDRAVRDHVDQEVEAIKEDNATKAKPFRTFAEVERFVSLFAYARRRRPILVLVGGTNWGKSELGADELRRIARLLSVPRFLEVTVEGDSALDFSAFDVRRDAGALLDGVDDALT